MGKVMMFTDNGRQIFLLALSIDVPEQHSERFAGAFKLDEPPGLMIGGEFVKDEQGRTQLFNTDTDAFDAAKALYESKK